MARAAPGGPSRAFVEGPLVPGVSAVSVVAWMGVFSTVIAACALAPNTQFPHKNELVNKSQALVDGGGAEEVARPCPEWPRLRTAVVTCVPEALHAVGSVGPW